MKNHSSSLDNMVDRWPSTIVARGRIPEFTGGAITAKYMANIDSAGEGPPRFRVGRKVVYPVDTLIRWLEERSSYAISHNTICPTRRVHRELQELSN